MQYHSFRDVFEKKNADILPEYHLYDCAIELKDGYILHLDQYIICHKRS